MSELRKFIRGCTKHPGATARLVDFCRAYRQETGDFKTLRREIIEQLTESDFQVASDGRTLWIAGLSLGAWQAVDGYLVADHATR